MKKILILIVLSFIFLLSGCKSKPLNTWEEIIERGYIVVGLDDTFAPMGFRNNSGDLVGFDVELAKEVGKMLNIEVRFQAIDWDSKTLELNSGTIDMIWNGLTITEDRKQEMLFSDPYIKNTQMILSTNNTNIVKIADLENKTVGVQISSSADEAVSKNSIVSKIKNLIKYDQYTQALIELDNNTIDAIVIDEVMGRYMISKTTNQYVVASEAFTEETYGIGFRLTSKSIKDKINDALNELKDKDIAKEISIKWFNEDIFI